MTFKKQEKIVIHALLSLSLILIVFALSSCATGPNNIDPTLQPLYKQFISQANNAGVNLQEDQGITIQFKSISDPYSPLGEIVGECSGIGHGNDTVYIDPDFWSNANDCNRLLVFYHELGHCILNEGHSPEPENIMNINLGVSDQYCDSLSDMEAKLFLQRN
jgi:hypothetical protein